MKKIAVLFLLISLYSCSKKEDLQPISKTNDTIIAKINCKSDHYSKIISYHMVIAGDTSKTSIVFFQNDEGKLHLGLGLGTGRRKANDLETKPYRQRYLEVEKLIKQAALELDKNTLKDVGIGYLIETGDLAIDVSREYFERYGNPGRIVWHQIGPKQREQINEVLMTSRAGKDINKLLAPFGKKIDHVTRAEQLQFLPKEAINYYTTYETNASLIPEFIMDTGIDFSVVDK